MTLFAALWSTGLRKIITSFAAAVTGLSGAVVASAVRLQLVRDKRMRLADQVLRWKVELEKTTDPATRLIIAQQMQTLEIEKTDAENEIVELMRGGR